MNRKALTKYIMIGFRSLKSIMMRIWPLKVFRMNYDGPFQPLSDEDATDFREIDDAIARLSKRRVEKIELEGPYLKSKIAWKIATFQQSVLYRVVMLARGARLSWNARNILACFILVRQLVETVALFDEFERSLMERFEAKDAGGIDALVMNRTFATMDTEFIKDYPDAKATNVLNFVDKLGKRYGLPIRDNYDSLSERVHPNSAGHHQMYSTTDKSNGTVTFSETKNMRRSAAFIQAPLGLVILFERTMNILDGAIPKIADWHDEIHPSPLAR